MASRERLPRTTVVGFLVAFGILLVLLTVVGVDDVLSAMAATDPVVLALILVVVFVWIGVWSGSLYRTARVFGVELRASETYLLYAHLMFLDNVVPFSSISADPFAALAVSRATDADYETSLATVITVDFFNFLPAPVFGLTGLVYLTATDPLDETLTSVTMTLTALLVGLSAFGYVGWRHRSRLASIASTAIARGLRAASSRLPRITVPSEAAIDDRIQDLVADLETMAADRRSLLVVSAFATIGWALLAVTLWLSMFAVGYAIPVGLAFFLVSLATVVELVPLPGGAGSAESLFVVLLVALSGVSPAVATAGVLVHRGATYWFPVVFGGGVIPVLLWNRA